MAFFSKPRSLSAYLVIIVAVAILPVLAFTSVMLWRFFQTQHRASEVALAKAADDLAHAFDQEMIATIHTLEAIGTSRTLRAGNLRQFHEELVHIVSTQSSWSAILLHDSNAKWLLSTRDRFGTILPPPPEPSSLDKVITSGEPLVGNVIPIGPKLLGSPSPASHGFAVRVPIKSANGTVKYVLSAVLTPDPVQKLIMSYSKEPGEWVRGIGDQALTLAARSRSPEKFIGHPFSESLTKSISRQSERGLVPSKTLDGVESLSAYRRAPFSGWYVALAVPRATLEAEARSTVYQLLTMGLSILAISATLTVLFSKWLSRSIITGTEAAAVLAKGEMPKMPTSQISEIERLRESLTTASHLLRSRERAKSDFLAKMSHELRTPLGLVLGMTDSLSKDLVAPEERDKSWEIVKRNGQQLLRLIDDILDLSKIEADALRVQSTPFSLTQLVCSIVEDFTPRLEKKNIKLRVVQEPGAPQSVNTDPTRLKQIIYNLVENAAKFTEAGSITIRVYPLDDDIVRIEVVDTGIGIEESQQEKLFNEFVQGESNHIRGGTGLGLALSRKLARLLGGDVRLLASQPNKGSRFEVTFKSEQGPPDSISNDDKEDRNLQIEMSLSNLKILLAEDSPDNVALIQIYMNGTGAKLTVASDGEEAVRAMEQNQFDIVLMDLQMPKMDGYEATSKLRSKGVEVPIVALTAHALDEFRDKALRAGFTDFLSKPIQRETLIETLARIRTS